MVPAVTTVASAKHGAALTRRRALRGAGAAGLAFVSRPVPAAPLPRALVPSTVLASLPPGSFMENLAFGPDGALYVTSYVGRGILRYDPASGVLRRLAVLDAHPVGIAFDRDGTGYVGAQAPASVFETRSFSGGDRLYRFDPRTGEVALHLAMPGAGFLNGLLSLAPGRLAAADSTQGVIWDIDLVARSVATLLRDQALSPLDPALPVPAANGIKRFGGHLTISNSQRALLARVPVDVGGTPTGALQVVREGLNADDFAFAADGTLFLAMHQDNVLRLALDGTLTAVAGVAEGVKGSTALVFGIGQADAASLYVVGDGGTYAHAFFRDPDLLSANLARLDVGVPGAAMP